MKISGELMRKKSLQLTLDKYYTKISEASIATKAATIALCADIERYFRIAFNIYLDKEIEEQDFRKITTIFPKLSGLNIKQFNELILIFINIRRVNAHLFLSKAIYLNQDIKKFIKENCNILYPIENNNKITLYGSIVILSLLSQKYMIYPFCTSFFKLQYFLEVGDSGKEMANFQMLMQNNLNNNCGISKQLPIEASQFSKVDLLYINDTLKRTLTLIFFDLEMVFARYTHSVSRTVSLYTMLKTSGIFSQELIDKIIKIRNCWLHGCYISEKIKFNEEILEFSLEFVIEVLIELLEIIKKYPNDFTKVINQIASLGKSFLDFYVLRIIELSFKIIDKRLLIQEKLDDRLDMLSKAFDRFVVIGPDLFELISKLISKDNIKWRLNGNKFTDKRKREFICSNLKIAKIYCPNGFIIGDYKTDRQNIVLALVQLRDENKNLINGYDINNINYFGEKEYSNFISIINIEM